MRKVLVTVLGCCLVLSGTDAQAGIRWPSVREAPADAPLAEPEDRAERLLGPLGVSEVDQRGDETRDIVAVLLSVVVGFGIGHMVAGEVPRGLMFMGIELAIAALAAALPIALFVIAATTTASTGLFTAMVIVLPLAILAMLGVRIWEIVDIVSRTGIGSRDRDRDDREAVITVDRRLPAAPPAVQPAFANTFNLRF